MGACVSAHKIFPDNESPYLTALANEPKSTNRRNVSVSISVAAAAVRRSEKHPKAFMAHNGLDSISSTRPQCMNRRRRMCFEK